MTNSHIPSVPAKLGAAHLALKLPPTPLTVPELRTLASAKESNAPHGWPVGGCNPDWTIYDDMRPLQPVRRVYRSGVLIARIEGKSPEDAQQLANQFVRAQAAADVLRCLLSYESVTVERDCELGQPPVINAMVPMHFFDQARAALGISK